MKDWKFEELEAMTGVYLISSKSSRFITKDRKEAQLIASAPELLKALQSAYKCSGERNKLTKLVLDEMLEAINKAIG